MGQGHEQYWRKGFDLREEESPRVVCDKLDHGRRGSQDVDAPQERLQDYQPRFEKRQLGFFTICRLYHGRDVAQVSRNAGQPWPANQETSHQFLVKFEHILFSIFKTW